MTITYALRSCSASDGNHDEIVYERVMNIPPDPDAATAIQYLMWALEYIEKTGDLTAAHHARLALEALRKRGSSALP